jgi:hypothetical protein
MERPDIGRPGLAALQVLAEHPARFGAARADRTCGPCAGRPFSCGNSPRCELLGRIFGRSTLRELTAERIETPGSELKPKTRSNIAGEAAANRHHA